MPNEQVAIQLPMIRLPGGLFIIIGGFIEIDAADEKAVVLKYVGGSTRTLDDKQSESFLLQVGVKERKVQPAPAGALGAGRFGRS